MNKTKTDRRSMPVDQQLDTEVIAFRQQFSERSPLDELVHRTFRRSRSRFDGFFESGVSYGHGGQGSFVRATNVVMGALVEWLRRADAP
jgi:hypothetical protein